MNRSKSRPDARAGVGEAQHIADHGAHARTTCVGGDAARRPQLTKSHTMRKYAEMFLSAEDLEFALEAGDLVGELGVNGGRRRRFLWPDSIPPLEAAGEHAEGHIAIDLALGEVIGGGRAGEGLELECGAVILVPRRQVADVRGVFA